MSEEPRKTEPPPLPPGEADEFPGADGAGVLEKTDDGNVAPTPAAAPLLLRALAFLMDWLLASVCLFAVLKWLVLPRHAAETDALVAWWRGFIEDYRNLIAQNALGAPGGGAAGGIMEQSRAFSEKLIFNFPAATASFLTQLAFFQTFYYWAFFFVTEYLAQGASLGKRIFHLRVASTNDFGAPGFVDSLLRAAMKALFFCSPNVPMLLVGIINAHVPLFTTTRRAWHDMLSRTIVLDANTSPYPDDGNDPNAAKDDGGDGGEGGGGGGGGN